VIVPVVLCGSETWSHSEGWRPPNQGTSNWCGSGVDVKRIYNFNLKTEGERQLERYRCRWKNNIKMDLKEIEYGVLNVI
jgi:hypothetical protein